MCYLYIMTENDILNIFEKIDTNSEYVQNKKTDTHRKTEMCTNTDAKVNRLLNGIQCKYSDKESLQEMLDETIKLLRQEEKENDILKVRCREYIKVIENKHAEIKELKLTNSKLEDKIKELEISFKKQFFTNYI